MGVSVITDSTSYIPRLLRDELGIGVASLSSLLDGVTYLDDPDDCAAFYAALAASGGFPTTSQPPLPDVVALMRSRVEAGNSVVGVFISEQMSGTFGTAQLARDMVLAEHPEAVIEIVDGRSNSMELGFAVLAAARAAAAGRSADEVAEAARDMTLHTRFLFSPVTLEYLRRGGRIGKAASLLGGLLQLKPVLTVADGVTQTFAKVRTTQRSLDLIADTFAADIAAKGGLGDAYVHHIAAPEAGRAFAGRLGEIAGRRIETRDIGPAVGTHVGPGTVGVVYWTNGLMDK